MAMSNFPLSNVPNKKANGYIPGKSYHCVGPVSWAQFENPKCFNKAIPVKVCWFIPDIGHENKHIYFTNLTGSDLAVSYNLTPLTITKPNQREYVQELGTRDVKHGTTVCLAVIPFCFHISFEDEQLDLRLRKYFATFSGTDIDSLRGKHLELFENAESSTLDIREGNAAQVGPNFAVITNTTKNIVTVNLHKYPAELDDIQEVRTVSNNRSLDLGPEVIEQVRIESGRSWHIKPQGTYYTLHTMDSVNANPRQSHVGTITQVPPNNDYIEGSYVTDARASDFVVATIDCDQNLMTLKIYAFNQIKPVSSTMVTNKTLGEND
jgi:hypothetical protein